MKYTDVVALINEKLDGDKLTEARLLKYMDSAVDDINDALSASYPTFSENKALPGFDGTYILFPDKYIRGVVVLGAAYKYYTTESEGDSVAGNYGGEYNAALFVMKRDFLESVPEIFQNLVAGILDIQNRYTPSTDVTYLYAQIALIKARLDALEAA
jgi:hypothetical protein